MNELLEKATQEDDLVALAKLAGIGEDTASTPANE